MPSVLKVTQFFDNQKQHKRELYFRSFEHLQTISEELKAQGGFVKSVYGEYVNKFLRQIKQVKVDMILDTFEPLFVELEDVNLESSFLTDLLFYDGPIWYWKDGNAYGPGYVCMVEKLLYINAKTHDCHVELLKEGEDKRANIASVNKNNLFFARKVPCPMSGF